MSHTYDELKHMTVAQLREIASGIEHEAVKGYTQLNKDHLLKALCEALGIEAHHHHEVVGIDKQKVKSKIRDLKKQRDAALAAKDNAQLRGILRRIHDLKRGMRRAMI